METNDTDTTTDGGTGSSDGGWGVGGIENSTVIRIVYGLCAFIGIIGNAVVCFALVRVPSLRRRTSSFIIHLSITDLITCVWVIPFHLFPQAPNVPGGIAGELMCRLYLSKYPFWATVFASVYSLVTINIERYIAILYPLKFKAWFTLTRLIIMMALCWVIGVVSNSFFLYLYDYAGGPGCAFNYWPSKGVQRFVGVYIFSLIYIIPVAIMLVAQLKMVRALKQQAHALTEKNLQNGSASKETKRETWQLKAAQDLERMLLIVIVTYIICWGPNQFIFFLYNMGAPIDFRKMYYHLSVVLAVMNSAINPCIYVFKNAAFRKGLAEAFGMKQFGSRVESSAPGTSGTNNTASTTIGNSTRNTTVTNHGANQEADA